MNNWNSEITNNPDDDYNLYIELLNGEDYVGKIFRDTDKKLKLQVYSDESTSSIPCDWLMKIIESAEKDI